MFERWGRLVFRFRWGFIVLSVVALAVSIRALGIHGNVDGPQPASPLESDRAARLASEELQSSHAGSSFLLLFSSPDLRAGDPAYQQALEGAVDPLKQDPRVVSVVTPYDASGQGLISRDQHESVVVIDVKDGSRTAATYLTALTRQVHPGPLHVVVTGNVPINDAFNTTLERDVQRAELISLPLALLLLLFIFRSAIAALLPVGVGVITILGGVGATLALSNVTYVSQYAFNIVTLIGLGVSIDYSLMLVSRFREELQSGASKEAALARTMATAGRAITFSGLAVAVGLSSLLFFNGTFLSSLGIAGAIVVALTVFYGLTLLPALLAVTGNGVNRLRLPWQRRAPRGRGFWYATAWQVMRRPVIILVPAAAFLLLAGTPFLHLRLANTGVDGLPPANQARQGYDRLVSDFAAFGNTEIPVVADFPAASVRGSAQTQAVAALGHQLAAIPGVVQVGPPRLGRHLAQLTVLTNLDASSDGARTIVRSIRALTVGAGGQLLVYGDTATDLDVIAFITSHMAEALGFVVVVTFLVMLLMTGSVVLPLKAVITNLLSISAAFGAMVWIFQDGHLRQLLNFTPQSIDPSVPVIAFALIFGLSMDYEVLLLARIQERWHATGDNTRAVAEGLERSGRLITGAAAIMIAVFLAFGLADVVLIKSIGIGIAVAIGIDATVVRALIVPSVMRLLGRANWWAPGPLGRLQNRAWQVEASVSPAA